jgi:ectoine hydroxylase-related dioxygenase (phytanoyl-CoA dioxygenase family)
MTHLDASASVADIVDVMHRDGFAVVDGLYAAHVDETRADLRRVLAATPLGRNDFEGHKTRRVYAVFAKTRTMDAAALHPTTLGVCEATLGPYFHFSAPVGIDIGPGEVAQGIHRDDSVHPVPRPHGQLVINSMWALDDFTVENGATVMYPGSHRWEPDRLPTPDDEMVRCTMPAGSVMFYGGDVLHGGGANLTSSPRLGVILEFCVSWLRPQENHCLAVPFELAATLPKRLQELLGYNIFPPFVGYVDGRHPRSVLRPSRPSAFE